MAAELPAMPDDSTPASANSLALEITCPPESATKSDPMPTRGKLRRAWTLLGMSEEPKDESGGVGRFENEKPPPGTAAEPETEEANGPPPLPCWKRLTSPPPPPPPPPPRPPAPGMAAPRPPCK